jgi:CRP-like cAMP-binding protein
MVSPELLRRYPFFGCLDEAQQKAIAMIAEQVEYEKGATLFQEGKPVPALYFLLDGNVDLYYAASGDVKDQFPVGAISPGEASGVSALIEPYTLTATARAAKASRVLKLDAAALRALCEVDNRMGYAMMRQVAKVAQERLHYARVQLAARA